ncbi:MAG: DoxX family protein [bacterium]|nr:DoxX family protein [bacterium]
MKTYASSDAALLLVRIGLGLIFIAHGWAKLADIEGTTAFFATIGLGVSLVWLVAIVELVAGLAMLSGLFTGIAGILIALTMVGAIITVKAQSGLIGGFLGGYEFDLMLFLSALAIAMAGPGKYTIKYLWNKA